MSIFRRRLMMGQRETVLPYDAEVEYLENVDRAYINTGIRASGNLYIKTYLVDFFIEANLGSWPFGGRNAYNDNAYGLFLATDTKKLNVAYNGATSVFNVYSSYPSSCWVEMKRGSIKVGNTTHTFTAKTFTSSYNVTLFGLNNGGKIVISSGKKIGSTYITNGTDTLDLIPVRKDGIGYMYDKISGRLYGNSNIYGSLIAGPDV